MTSLNEELNDVGEPEFLHNKSDISETKHRPPIENKGCWHNITRPLSPGSLRAVILLWMRMTMGVGVLTLPYYMSQFGILFGCLILLMCSLLTYFSCKFIFEATDVSNVTDYITLIEKMLSKRVYKIFRFTYFIDLMFPILVYTIFSWSLYENLLYSFGFMKEEWVEDHRKLTFKEFSPEVYLRRAVYFGILFLAQIPLMLQKSLKAFKPISMVFLATLGILIMWILCEMPFFNNSLGPKGELNVELWFKKPTWQAVPQIFSILLSFYVMPYILNLRQELADPILRRTKKIALNSILAELIIFILFCSIVYACLGDRFTPSLVIIRKPFEGKNEISELLFKFVIFLFFVLNTVGIACYNPPIVDNLKNFFNSKNKKFNTALQLLPFGLSVIISILVPNILTIFWILGLTVCNFNGFIIPVLLKLELLGMQIGTGKQKIKYYLLLAFYIACGIGGIAIKVFDL